MNASKVLVWLEYISSCVGAVTAGVRTCVERWPASPNSGGGEKEPIQRERESGPSNSPARIKQI